jgi:hypothetical protein
MACNKYYNALFTNLILSAKWFNQDAVLQYSDTFIDKISKIYNVTDLTKIPKWCTHIGLTTRVINNLPETVEHIYLPINISYISQPPPHFGRYTIEISNQWIQISKLC